MLLWLSEWLAQHISVFNVFQYLTLRAILGALTALGISLAVGPALIRRLAEKQIGQTIRQDGPQSHLSKAGTPTMGGVLILVSIISIFESGYGSQLINGLMIAGQKVPTVTRAGSAITLDVFGFGYCRLSRSFGRINAYRDDIKLIANIKRNIFEVFDHTF